MNQHDDAAAVASPLQDGSESDAADASSRADRPTLIGMAPIDGELDTDAAGSGPAADEPARAQVETSTVVPVQLLASEAAPAPAAPEEDDPEWLDLSTRWMVTPKQPAARPPVDEDEVTEHVQWADRLAVQAFARRESAAPPPPQPLSAAPPGLRVTMPFGRPSEAPAAQRANTGAFSAQGQWAPRAGRHVTLAGASALAEERGRWSGAQEGYDMPPAAAPMQPPPAASWSGPGAGAPPWAAGAGYAARYPAPSPYALDERHTGTPTGYTPFYVAKRGEAGRRRRAPRQKASELSVELWESISDTWLATLIKCALALVLFHYSGLAVPLLAFFGYAPMQPAATSSRSEAAMQAVLPVSVPTAATVAAPSVMPARVAPASDEDALPRRSIPQREVSATTEIITRHYRAKPAHKPKPAAPDRLPVAVAAPHTLPNVASRVVTAQALPNVAPQPLTAAEVESDDAAGEAFLRLNSRPWSQVFVDGTDVGHTPKLDLRVRAGSHRIRFVNPELGVSKTIQLRAVVGATVSHIEFLED